MIPRWPSDETQISPRWPSDEPQTTPRCPPGDSDVIRCDAMWNDVMWCDVMWFGVIWCDVMWCDVMWFDVMWCDVVGDVMFEVMLCKCDGHLEEWCDAMWCKSVRGMYKDRCVHHIRVSSKQDVETVQKARETPCEMVEKRRENEPKKECGKAGSWHANLGPKRNRLKKGKL